MGRVRKRTGKRLLTLLLEEFGTRNMPTLLSKLVTLVSGVVKLWRSLSTLFTTVPTGTRNAAIL
eukprot:4552937-Amphidinium_carterae.1